MGYHKTGQFRNAYKVLKSAGAGEVKLSGTVKLHGTYGCLGVDSDGKITAYSKNNQLASMEISRGVKHGSNNFNFQGLLSDRRNGVEHMLESLRTISGMEELSVHGEWAGSGVRQGAAISELDEQFYVFGIKLLDTYWVDPSEMKSLSGVITDSGFECLYDESKFPQYTVSFNPTLPELIALDMAEITQKVEDECPVAKHFGVSGIGEGVVWVPDDSELCDNTDTWFKVKGQKHSSSKVKKLATVDPEKLASIQEFIEYAATVNRLEQGLKEFGGEMDIKQIDKYIGWVKRDINQEESDTLESNSLTMKEVGKYISQEARTFFIKELDKLAGIA